MLLEKRTHRLPWWDKPDEMAGVDCVEFNFKGYNEKKKVLQSLQPRLLIRPLSSSCICI